LGDKSSVVSLSSDGSVVAIGARGFMEDSGHVRVFQWNGTNWAQMGDSMDGDEAGDMSGSSVSLSSDGFRVAIGASYYGDNDSGHVRVYEYSQSRDNWTQMGDDLDGEDNNDESGEVSLSSDGTTVAIAAGKNNGNGEDSGHVRVYKYSGGTWTQIGTDIDGETAGDLSGFVSLSSDGSTVAIGAMMNDGNGEDSGHVRVYTIECIQTCPAGQFSTAAGRWNVVGNVIEGMHQNDHNGKSVSLSSDGTVVAIGVPFNGGSPYGQINNGKGTVHVYSYDGSTWVQMGEDIDGDAVGDRAGSEVSLSSDGSVLAIGAPRNGGSEKFGQVRVYSYNGSNWIQMGDAIYGRNGELAGGAVALSSNGLVLAVGGANLDANTGQVRVFEWIEPDYPSTQTVQYDGQTYEACVGGPVITVDKDGNHNVYEDGKAVYGTLSSDDFDDTDGLLNAMPGQTRSFYCSAHPAATFKVTCPEQKWTQRGLNLTLGLESTYSGESVSLNSDGSVLAFGSPFDGNGGSNRRGRVDIYQWDEAQWAWVPKGLHIQGESNDGNYSSWTPGDMYTGYSVSLSDDGSSIAIGAYAYIHGYADGITEQPGRVRVFQWNGTDWIQKGRNLLGMRSYAAWWETYFGFSVSLSGDGSTLIAGAYGSKAGDYVQAFRFGNDWEQLGETVYGDTRTDFGYAVSISENGLTMAVGSPRSWDDNPGLVRVFKIGECQSCLKGTFKDQTSQTCKSCLVGRYSDETGLIECKQCPLETYRNETSGTSVSDCTECPFGQYGDILGADDIADCKVCDGSSPDSPGCLTCPTGTFLESEECKPCSTGRYSDELDLTSNEQCKKCPLGTYQDQNGTTHVSECKGCAPGKYGDLEGATDASVCKDCGVGKYTNELGFSTCKNCEAGKYQGGSGATSCDECVVGKFGDLEGATDASVCKDCAGGKYNNIAGRSQCIDCGTGTYSSSIGLSSESCVRCPSGKYGDVEGATNLSSCTDCNLGRYNDQTGYSQCKGCPQGTYGDEIGSTICKSCPGGKYGNRLYLTDISNCTDCMVGKYGWTPLSCRDCSQGTYGDETGLAYCKQCPTGKYGDEEGASTCEDCPVGKNGYTMGRVHCSLCVKGRYQNETGKNDCKRCSSGKYLDEEGASACKDCTAGKYQQYNIGMPWCYNCTVGKYGDMLGSNESSDCKDCEIGRYGDEEGASACKGCPVGKYSKDIGRWGHCYNCTAGKYGDVLGSTKASDCKACMVGRYQPLEGQTSLGACEFCSSGKYSNESGAIQSSVCKDCPVGFYNGFEHSNECYSCGGHHGDNYADETGLTECKDCPLGFFQEGYGATAAECDSCSAGKYVTLEDNVIVCVACPHGQYQDQNGMYECKYCTQTGKYAGGEGLAECLDCPTGYYSSYANAEYLETERSDHCKACGPGRFQNDLQGAWCVDCSSGTYNDEEGQGECKKCADAGTYTTGLKQTSCADCPAGYASSSEASSCTACSSGEYQTDANGAACQDCPAGFESSGAASSCDEINECNTSPCVNGNCTDLVNSYKCACEPGYDGVNCTVNIDDCATSPCVNGNCTDILNGYNCVCEPGYEGTDCETDIDDCANVTCISRGKCIDEVNGYYCKPYKVTGDFNFYVLAVWVGIAAIVLICVGLKSTHDSVKDFVDAPSNPIKEKKQLYW
jgi:hypothetical protein